mmetsp:Transcript_4735/g.3936  ORF Transcript_4735/g.3936 Transcript_4735/m.3936 type:complete len:84 (+) Transcript_4735:533-784(+)
MLRITSTGDEDNISSSALELFRQEVYGLINNIKDNYVKNEDFESYKNKVSDEFEELKKNLENFVTKPDFESYQSQTDNKLQSH